MWGIYLIQIEDRNCYTEKFSALDVKDVSLKNDDFFRNGDRLWWIPCKLSELASEPFVLYTIKYVQIRRTNKM